MKAIKHDITHPPNDGISVASETGLAFWFSVAQVVKDGVDEQLPVGAFSFNRPRFLVEAM